MLNFGGLEQLENNKKLVLSKFTVNLLIQSHSSILSNSWLTLFCKDNTSLCAKVRTLSSAYNVTTKLEQRVKSLI